MFTRSHLDMSKFMQDYFVTDEYPNSLNETSAFLEIQTMDDIWNYLENQLLNGIYWNEIADMDDPLEKTLFNENKYLGKVRLRMLRVYNKTCDSPEFFKRETRECMPIYSKSVENKEPFGPANSSAYIYSEETELGTKDFTTFDSLITYGGGGFIQDLPTDNHEEALNIVHSLKEDQWIDQQTRMLFIDFTTYNIHIKLYTAVKLYIEITPFDIFPHRSIKSVNLYRYETFDDYLYLVFEAIFCSFTIFYFIQDMFEFYKKRMAYFDENWNVIDFIVLSVSYFGDFEKLPKNRKSDNF
uniref:Polycystin domain-containing protein n=1 Tax=Panagrolaimus superbus TaxID=310955 RepID=A0A914Y7K7_9BILA